MYTLVLHKNLDKNKWLKFPIDKQILMIGNELNRGLNLSKQKNNQYEVNLCLERAFELTDLTINCNNNTHFRKELFRFRYLLAEIYCSFNRTNLKKLFKVLLSLNSQSWAALP